MSLDTTRGELIRKLHNNGLAPVAATDLVAKALAMPPANGAEYLKQQGLDYLQCFTLLSAVTAEEIQSERNQGEGIFAVFFPKRLTRGEYLLRYILITVGLVLCVGSGALAKMRGLHGSATPAVCFILIILYKVAVMDAARFRDRGKEGFWACVMILPFVNMIVQFYLWFAR